MTNQAIPDARLESIVHTAARRIGRVLGWCVIIASPLAVIVGLVVLRPSPPPEAPQSERLLKADEPQGWAEMYVRSWLSAHRGDSAGLEAFYPAGMKSTRAVGTQIPVDTSTLSVWSPRLGAWSVMVAADVLVQQPDGKHRARLVCAEASLVGNGEGYVATSLPTPVACPRTLAAVELDYPETAEPNGPIGQSVHGFLLAYLVGRGELNRYVAPGTNIGAIVPPLYAEVQLLELRTHEPFEPGQAARPLDGTEVHATARAWGYDGLGQVTTIDYALTLVARAGRWEISRIDPVPLPAGE
ncbi:conjugal transfer protein [Amycolatopsis orientalis]|uniref:conjugal transfer protein n=1 Tax=Amycolatopsis orientalis TaxID=31958 RepID=UPI000A767A5E|nr:conjugal transfer protein [Amycolatopsis orientalis]